MLKNIISAFLARGLVAFINLAVLLILSKQLGSEIVGQVSLLILNIAIIQTINNIYTGPALVYFIPKYSLQSIYKTGLLWTIFCIFFLNLLFYLFEIGVRALWIHVLMLSLISTIHAFHLVLILAREKIKTYNFLIFFQPVLLLTVLALAVFLAKFQTVNAMLLAMYLSFGIALILSSLHLIKITSEDQRDLPDAENASVFTNGFINQLGNLAHTLSNRYNYYLIGTTALVGVYANATSLIESVLIIGASISPIILTHIANQRDVNNNARLTFLLSKTSLLLSLLCVFIIWMLPNSFYVYFLGADFINVKKLMLYLSPGILCISFVSVISHYFSGLGQQKVQLWANCSGLIVTICISHFLISKYGLVGACFTATFSYLAASLIFVAVFLKQNKYKIRELFTFKQDLSLLREKK